MVRSDQHTAFRPHVRYGSPGDCNIKYLCPALLATNVSSLIHVLPIEEWQNPYATASHSRPVAGLGFTSRLAQTDGVVRTMTAVSCEHTSTTRSLAPRGTHTEHIYMFQHNYIHVVRTLTDHAAVLVWLGARAGMTGATRHKRLGCSH